MNLPAKADRDLTVSQHHSDITDASNHRSRPWTSRPGSLCASQYTTVQLPTLDRPNCQRHCGGFPQMVHLRMAADTELFQDVSNDCLAVDNYGDSVELPGTGFDVPRLHTP